MKTSLLIAALLSSVAFAGESTCQIQMTDKLNTVNGVPSVNKLELKSLNRLDKMQMYLITDKVNTKNAWQEIFGISKETSLVHVHSGLVGRYKLEEIKENYKMEDDSQLSFKVIEETSCNESEKALIYYYIMEWFYFG